MYLMKLKDKKTGTIKTLGSKAGDPNSYTWMHPMVKQLAIQFESIEDAKRFQSKNMLPYEPNRYDLYLVHYKPTKFYHKNPSGRKQQKRFRDLSIGEEFSFVSGNRMIDSFYDDVIKTGPRTYESLDDPGAKHHVGSINAKVYPTRSERKRNPKHQLGSRVETTAGVYRSGTIIKPFDWRESTDGTYKQPSNNDLPIKWDDGSKGYHNKRYLLFTERKSNPNQYVIRLHITEPGRQGIFTLSKQEHHYDFLMGENPARKVTFNSIPQARKFWQQYGSSPTREQHKVFIEYDGRR